MARDKKRLGKKLKSPRRKAAPSRRSSEAKSRPARGRSGKSQQTRVTKLARELGHALQRQSATAEILKVIASSRSDVQPVFDVIVQTSRELCRSQASTIFILREGKFHVVAFSGVQTELLRHMKDHPISIDQKGSALARAAREKRTIHIPNTLEDPEFVEGGPISIGGPRATLTVPLMRDGEVIGGITLRQSYLTPYTPRQIEAIETFASQAVIAIENARLFEEVQAKTRDLTEALTYQTGSGNILRVIASSPTDVGPVLKAIVESACELCGADDAVAHLREGDDLRSTAHHGSIPVGMDKRPINRNFASGRATIDKVPIHVHDVLSVEGDDLPEAQEMSRRVGIRTILCVPLLRENESIGTILLRRTEVAPFSDKQIALLRTFANQAVIAIENARLFNETKEALERQTATADILKVIASSPSDVQPVFDAIAERSKRLVDALSTTVFRLVDGMMHLRAFTPTTPEADARLQAMFPAPLSTFSWGVSIRSGEIYRVDDTEHEPEGLRDLARLRGWRSCLCVPLLRDGKPIGMIGPTRVEPGPFADHHVQLLQTFADQAVIAISNVELFQQVQERTRELSASLDDLRATQDRLVQTEKLASLGQLTAGIAHEIKNPLNFVNNFSALSAELIEEMKDVLSDVSLDNNKREELDQITKMLKDNLEKVVQHGKRADSIVKNMLQHSRQGSSEHRVVDINAIVDESLNLAYHGARAEKAGFSITLQRDLDPSVGMADVYPQEITRALLNLVSNGFYATTKRKAEAGDGFEPMLYATTKNLGDKVEIRIRDNGTGIPEEVKEKIFNPFFTTKPAGEGTGLGLSMSHDIIVKQHGGSIDVESEPGLFTEFKIVLPRKSQR